jgi:Uri superfamily endonuclease
MATEKPLTNVGDGDRLSFNALVKQDNKTIQEHADGVYVLRTSLSGTNGYYVGSSQRDVWKRVNSHGKKRGNYRDDAPIGHDIDGVEAAFLRFGEIDTWHCSALRKIETLIAAAFMDRYGPERVYGAGYSDKTTPSYHSFDVTPEFAVGVTDSEYEWLLDYNTREQPAVDPPHYNDNLFDSRGKPRVWRVVSSPPLPRC